MRLIDNPFYILDVSTTDNRQTIISKAEEKSFFEDSSVCSEAQNILLNIIKRTSAELSWFPGTDNSKIREICNAIKNNQTINLSGLGSIARLNACVHNFSLQTHEDVYETGYSVLEIDELFESLDAIEVTDIINNDRQKAGIKEISENEVSAELQKIREYISHVITEKAQDFSDDQYAEFATLIAEKCIADTSYNDGIVIDDIINQYEIWVQPVLSEYETEIRSIIKKVETVLTKEHYSSDINERNSYEASLQISTQKNVDSILQKLKSWDVYAQPLQLRDTARGYGNTNSQNLARDIRELAILLYNEKGYTELSIKITNYLKSVFAELPEFVDKVSNDERILKENKAQEALDKLREQNRQVAVAQQQKRNFGSNLIGCLSPLAGFAILIVIILIIAGLSECSSDSDDSSSKSSKPSSSYSGGTNNYYDYDDYEDSNSTKTYTVILDKQNGTGGSYSVTATYGKELPYATAPTRSGYEFNGFYSKTNGLGTKYYDSNMNSVANWYGNSNETIYAYWIKKTDGSNLNGVNITKDNFEEYFTLTTEAEFVGNDVKITYSIKPKDSSYAKNSNSSSTISVEIGAVVSPFSFYYGEPSYNEKYTVTLSKNQNYTASGSFSFYYYSFTETVYWMADVTYCSGTIGK